MPPGDTELAEVVSAWTDLPGAVRAGILAMVRASGVKKAKGSNRSKRPGV